MELRREFVFSMKELRHVVIACPQCKTEVVLDMAGFTPPFAGETRTRMAFAPRQCPACKNNYDTALLQLEELQRAYLALSRLGKTVTLRAAVENEGE